jgi:hypothetical protein
LAPEIINATCSKSNSVIKQVDGPRRPPSAPSTSQPFGPIPIDPDVRTVEKPEITIWKDLSAVGVLPLTVANGRIMHAEVPIIFTSVLGLLVSRRRCSQKSTITASTPSPVHFEVVKTIRTHEWIQAAPSKFSFHI